MERETIRPVKEVYSQTNIPEPKRANLKNYSDICSRFAN